MMSPAVYRFAKRTLYVSVALAAVAVLLPLFLVIALAVWLEDPGAPVIFRQPRCGFKGRTFQLYKFRTMVRDADALKEDLRARSTVAWPDFRLQDDPRVTRLGRWLRRTSLDELPQFLNVLLGDMSLVGPRPTSFLAETYEPWQMARLEFKPGITGPWQVLGRNSMDFGDRCRLEIEFFTQRSLRAELSLLPATVGCVLKRTGVA